MNKQEFLGRLREELCGLPPSDLEERLAFYGEMIDDRREEGLSEEDAVAAVGAVEEVVAQIVADTPFTKIAKERMRKNRRLKGWEIVLLAVGSPVWFSLLIAVLAVAFSLYAVLWVGIVSLWAAEVSLWGCALGGIFGGILIALRGEFASAIALVSAGLVCGGLSVFLFYGCKAATKGALLLTKKIVLGIKSALVKKEVAG